MKHLHTQSQRFPDDRKSLFGTASIWVHIGLILIMLFALGLCLWLFLDILASRRQIQLLLSQSSLDETVLQSFKNTYQREIRLDLLLTLAVVALGIMVFGFASFYFRTARLLRDVRSIEDYILQSITRGVLTVDREGRITSCNRAMQQILGICREGCRNQPVLSLLPADDPILQMLLQVMQQGGRQEQEHEISYMRSDGKNLPLRITASDLRDEQGRLIGSILLAKNLAQIRSLEEKLRRQDRLAALGELTRRIMHEIRNPLSAMDMNLQLLQERLEKLLGEEFDPKIQRYLNITFSELHRLDAILQDTHLSVNPPPLHTVPLDLHQVIREVVMKMDAEARHLGHEFVLAIGQHTACILGDRNLLTQAFVNLFKNAIEAMAGKQGRIIVNSRLHRKDQILIAIQDNGKGIDWRDLPRIFDPYFTTRPKGTGLGLSIVHNVVTQHGGDIHVGSWVGEGTLFELYFPLIEMPQH